jgi:pyridoxal phosphate enzyme (YggS family)
MTSTPDRALRDAVSANAARVRERLAAACARAGRAPSDVTIVAVAKYGGPALASALLDAGLLDLGENRVEHLLSVDAALPRTGPRPRWHQVGHLQRNKAKKVASLLASLHSLDSLDLATKLDALRREAARPPLPVYVEVNVGLETQKSGIAPAEVEAFARSLRGLAHLDVRGLMAIPPAVDQAEQVRPHFRALRALLPALEAGLGRPAPGLSMGMTDDWEVAVEEGATVVRIGRAFIESVPEHALSADRGT